MMRLFQYFKRVANVVLFALPGQYQRRRLQILEEMFQKSIDVINRSGEPYWLDFGTLLGYHRSGGIIPHDIDIDIAMNESSYEKIKSIKNELPRGVSFYDTSGNHDGPKIYFSYKGYDLDIFFYQDLGETVRSYVEAKWPNERQELSKNLIFPLKSDQFLNREVTVPAKTKDYLEQMYGYLGTGGWRDQTTGLWHPPKD